MYGQVLPLIYSPPERSAVTAGLVLLPTIIVELFYHKERTSARLFENAAPGLRITTMPKLKISESVINNQLAPYRRNGIITARKLREYIPAMLVANISSLLLLTVNGLVVGNFVSSEALACVSFIDPVESLINTGSTLTACGIATSLSTAMGSGNSEAYEQNRVSSMRLMIVMSLLITAIELPLAWLVIRSYNLSAAMFAMTWQYALIRILSSPLEIFSVVCVYDLQILGKMKAVMWLTLTAGVSNLLFDLLFVAGLHMGVAGAGYGTACALLLRAVLSGTYIARRTDLFNRSRRKARLSDFSKILEYGVPDASYMFMGAVQDYFMIRILLFAFGADGGVISGVCTFCSGLASVFIRSVQNSARPMMGLLAGADDRVELGMLMRQAITVDLITVGAVVLLAEFFPATFFHIHGVRQIPGGGLASLRIYVVFLLIKGCCTMLRMYLTNRGDSRYATAATVAGIATLPVFSYLFVLWAGGPFLWLGYSAAELLTMVIYLGRVRRWEQNDLDNESADHSLFLSVDPSHATAAADTVMNYLQQEGIDSRMTYRIALCMEEIGAYAQNAGRRNENAEICIRIKITGDSDAIIIIIDDGKCIYLDTDEEERHVISDNYSLIRRIAKSVEYQYILNLNYTRITL